MVDGIPTYFESRWNLGDSATDTALYDRVEVVRGANGLMTGTGNPSASINMVRKGGKGVMIACVYLVL